MASTDNMALVKTGEVVDYYYYDRNNLQKTAFKTIQNNRFTSAFQTLSQGTNTIIVSPLDGITDVMAVFQLPTQSYTGLALNRGWGYGLIKNVSIRYGGSTMVQMTGKQILLQNMYQACSKEQKDLVYSAGGAECLTAGAFAGDNMYAYCYISLPHSSLSADETKPLPCPTDLLTSPVVITIEINPLSSIFSVQGGTAPTQLAKAYAQIQQVLFQDKGDRLASRAVIKDKIYSYPVSYFQQEYTTNISGNTSTPIPINLTGFRSGECKSIILWLTKPTDETGATKNINRVYLPRNLTLSWNGETLFQSEGTASILFNLANEKSTPVFDGSVVSWTGSAFTSLPTNQVYAVVPFAQFSDAVFGSHVHVSGLAVQNAVVNLSLTTPDTDAYVLHAVYLYNSSLLFSNGNAEFVF